ncbi:hypothetical protein H0G86_007768 [Trichoderma simmonsii]|uniref:Uncharacterized protein n=1 Tax=Trichoderma simmonsii TaxID=1491479 RepID=A0A8G0LH36_9HYPO|nr:hypothetical protein H0G86_007768 [Trichoderma simmonsii]
MQKHRRSGSTYGPSLQVKTLPNPHDLTCASCRSPILAGACFFDCRPRPAGILQGEPLRWTPVWADRRSDEEAADTIRRETVAELGRVSLVASAAAQLKHNH